MADYSEGDRVEWDWGQGVGQGRVEEIHKCKLTRKIKGSEITRNGSDDNPALVIVQEDGDQVLKLSSEVRRA
ncbi:DUF2945 domain-containing protein [Sulfitobacter aestuarii]|uniref:DUF2945 domain-containing protein n=1 Tax=Sulfitobacter aestuarii TaxID=2161676 RepID=A0ABW5U3L6_9RHOB